MKTFSFGEIDPEDLLLRLTLYAYSLFGCFPDPIFEPVMEFHGASPEDLAITTLTRLLDPDDHSVEWKANYGQMTRDSLLGFLKTVLVHDFIDMKRKGMYKASVYLPLLSDAHEGENGEMTLDDFNTKLESPEAKAIRKQQREQLLAKFNDEPELKELLTPDLGSQSVHSHERKTLSEASVAEGLESTSQLGGPSFPARTLVSPVPQYLSVDLAANCVLPAATAPRVTRVEPGPSRYPEV